jgi:hypothetical protein
MAGYMAGVADMSIKESKKYFPITLNCLSTHAPE